MRNLSYAGAVLVLIVALPLAVWLDMRHLSETSLQAQILIPLATSIVFGMMASTVLVLLVVPALYTILGDFGLTAVAGVDGAGTRE